MLFTRFFRYINVQVTRMFSGRRQRGMVLVIYNIGNVPRHIYTTRRDTFGVFFHHRLGIPPVVFLVTVSIDYHSYSVDFECVHSFLQRDMSVSAAHLYISLSKASVYDSVVMPDFAAH